MADALDRLAPPEPLLESADGPESLQEPRENESHEPVHPEDR
jgi:hypothetical protein